jgi:transcriptional regulator with XRE-family HTH domain
MNKKSSLKKEFLQKQGKRIVGERKKINMSQVELAHVCNKDPQSLERVENGKVNPSAFYLLEIAEVLVFSYKNYFRASLTTPFKKNIFRSIQILNMAQGFSVDNSNHFVHFV